MTVTRRPIDRTIAERLISSGDTTPIPLEDGPPWAQGIPGIEGLYGIGYSDGSREVKSDGTVVENAVGNIDILRSDQSTGQLKCYRWIIAKSDGTYEQVGPMKDQWDQTLILGNDTD